MQSINLPSSVKIRARHIGKQLRKYSDILHPRKDLDCNSRDPEHTMTILLSSPTQTMLVKLTREDKPQDSCSHSIAELSPGPADVKTASHYLQWNRNILRPATVREKRSGCVVWLHKSELFSKSNSSVLWQQERNLHNSQPGTSYKIKTHRSEVLLSQR